MKNGFTIIELMLTIAVIAVVLAVGVPSFSTAIQNNRLISQSNSLIGALNYARSEAVKLGQNNVTICGSSTGAACNTGNWESGYLIFRDTDGDGAVDVGETILRVEQALSGGNTLRTAGFPSSQRVSFNSQGMVSTTGSFKLCDDRGANEAKALVINISGQTRVATDDTTPANNTVNLHDGSEIVCP